MAKKIKEDWFTLRNEDTDTPEMAMVGYIGNDESINYNFVKASIQGLKQMGKTKCKVVVNSGGGDIVEGLAIYDEMQASGIDFDMHIVGMAASMASIIVQGGKDRPVMSPNSRMMFHKPQMGMSGEADALRDIADLGDKLEDNLKAILVARSGNTADVVNSWFKPGRMTWMSAAECVANKVARGITTEDTTETGQSPVPIEDLLTMSDRDAWLKIYNKTSITNQNKNDMKLTAKNTTDLKLNDGASELDINNAVAGIIADHAAAIAALKDFKDAAGVKLKADAKAFADVGITNKQITEAERTDWEELYLANSAMAVKNLAKMTPAKLPNNHIKAQNANEGKPGKGGKKDEVEFDEDNTDTWTLDNWAQYDGDGLENMKMNDREKFAALCKAAGVKPVYN